VGYQFFFFFFTLFNINRLINKLGSFGWITFQTACGLLALQFSSDNGKSFGHGGISIRSKV